MKKVITPYLGSVRDLQRIDNLAKLNNVPPQRLRASLVKTIKNIEQFTKEEINGLSIKDNFEEATILIILKGKINFVTLQGKIGLSV